MMLIKDIEATNEAKLAKLVVWIEQELDCFVVYTRPKSEAASIEVGRFASCADAQAVMYWARIEASNPALARQMRWKIEAADQWGRFEEEKN